MELDDAAAAVADQLDALESENRARWFEAREEQLRTDKVEHELKTIETQLPSHQLHVLRERQKGDAVEAAR